MGESLNSVGAITMFIEDTQRAKVFYEQVFDAKAIYEDENAVAFEFENMVVNLLRAPAAHDLISPAPVGGADVARRFQLTIWVEDADAVCEQLAAHGVELLNGPIDREWECAPPRSPIPTATSGRSPRRSHHRELRGTALSSDIAERWPRALPAN